MSLSAHLTADTAKHGRLTFHPDCPRCAERLAGSLGPDTLVSRRATAALAAGLLAFSTAAPPAVAQVSETEEEQEGQAAPESDQGGLETEFDPGGGDDSFDSDTAPIPGGGEAGGQEDDGQGAPVETEPFTDDTPIVPDDALPEPEPAPTPEPAPAPTPAPAPPTPPAASAPPPMPPPAPPPPAAEVEPPSPQPQQPRTSTTRKPRTPQAERREREPRPVTGANPAPAPVSEAPIPTPAVQAPDSTPPAGPPPTAVPVSQPTEPVDRPVRGASYTVQAGDSLWSIARRQLGPEASAGQIARQVNRLWQLNEQRIGTGNPSLLHIGTELRLP